MMMMMMNVALFHRNKKVFKLQVAPPPPRGRSQVCVCHQRHFNFLIAYSYVWHLGPSLNCFSLPSGSLLTCLVKEIDQIFTLYHYIVLSESILYSSKTTKSDQTATRIKSDVLIGLRRTNQNVGVLVGMLVCEQKSALIRKWTGHFQWQGERQTHWGRERRNILESLGVAEVWRYPLIFIHWNNHQCDSIDR